MYNDFYNNILPGNYALTKSMELTKINTSGTLWYTKKFLVLYYFVFLTNDIYTRTYINKIVEIFDDYINSLDNSLKSCAEKFFYGDSESINFKSENFISFSNFTDFTNFNSEGEKQDYDRAARKYYFSLLMGVGGQTGVKKELKELIKAPGFVYDEANLSNLIKEAAIKVAVEQINNGHAISDNSVKYVISDEAIGELISISQTQSINESDVNKAMSSYPKERMNVTTIKNDVVAFIRNERQILFYYGFVHSKSSGATDFEFSSLTPIGHEALKANFYEFLAIWEHQKVKMISQPVTAEINDVPAHASTSGKFSISYTPYLDILGTLSRRNSFSVEEYMYIISRRNHNYSADTWNSHEDDIFSHITDIKAKVLSFGRIRDTKEEDGRKELLKYMLGVRSDMSLDNNLNPIAFCKYDNRKWVASDNQKLESIYKVYKNLNNYKILKYKDLFERCEDDLSNRYVANSNGNTIVMDPKVKIDWDLYNMREDKFILFSIVFTISASKCGFELLNLDKNSIVSVVDDSLNNFRNLLKNYGLTSKIKIKSMLMLILSALNNEDYSKFIDEAEGKEQVLAEYKSESASDLFARLEQLSSANSSVDGERHRNTSLIGILKSYYMARFLENNLLKCECCGHETFITQSGEPYVEFHHLIPFSIVNGPDHYLNLYGLCPNCHRKIHFIKIDEKENQYKKIDTNNYLRLSIEDRLRKLKDENILQSYHLEYLLADRAISQSQYNIIAA